MVPEPIVVDKVIRDVVKFIKELELIKEVILLEVEIVVIKGLLEVEAAIGNWTTDELASLLFPWYPTSPWIK